MALPASEVTGELYPKFTDGEYFVGPESLDAAAGMASFYFARNFDGLTPGNYVIKMTADDAATVWVGTDMQSTRMVGSCVFDALLTAYEFEFVLYEGERRIDVYLHNLTTLPSRAGFIFSMYRDGLLVYASRATHWLYDTAGPIADDELLGGQDTRRMLPVFTVLPNWKDGVLERVEYLTDILEGERATEQRRGLRSIPRRSIEAGFARTKVVQDRLHNFFTGVGLQQFLVPLWFEQYRLGVEFGPADTLLTFPTGDLAMREFRDGDTALIIDKSPDTFDVVTIESVDAVAGTITIGAGVTLTWNASARIIPLRRARLVERPQMGNRTDETGVVNVRFELLDGDNGGGSWAFCVPLFKLEPNWAQPVTHGYDRLTFALDNQIAHPSVVGSSDQTLITQRANYTLRHREQVRYFRDFINQAHGRAMRFYVPSYTDDVQPLDQGVIPGGVRYFDIQPSGLWEMMLTRQFSRRTLGFFFKDGSPTLYRTVELIEPVGLSGPPYRMSAERLHLDQDMPPVNMQEVRRISWIHVVRFDQDGFEMKHEVDDSAVVTTALVFRGVDPEGMPPIDCVVTSRPYPIDAVDAVTASHLVTGGRIYEPNYVMDPESITSAHALTGGTLRDLLHSYSMDPESITSTHALTGGTLRDILRSYTHWAAEGMDIGAALSEGTLRTALITYAEWPAEGMDITAFLSEGTLS